MKNNLKIGLAVAFVLAMSLAVAGCTSNTSNNSGNSGQAALTLTAVKEPTPANITSVYGNNIVTINATLHNNDAGTFKISTDDYYLKDSNGQIYQDIGNAATAVSHSGYDNWVRMSFQIASGATVSQLEYNDGTHDLTCAVD